MSPDMYDISLAALERLMRAEFHFHSPRDHHFYTPIPPSAPIIRLLHLRPGLLSSSLSADLSFTPLSCPAPYTAISYSWGDGLAKTGTLRLSDSTSLPITASLDTALRHLRSQTETRTIWVDAVCINQLDPLERAEQVQLMGTVYSSAEEVVCWLGEDNGVRDGERAFELLRRIGRVSFRGAEKGRVPEGSMRSAGLPPAGDEGWRAVMWLYNLPWFHRLWVVQEFVLGRRVRFMCGRKAVDWRQLDLGNQKVGEYHLLGWGVSDRAEEREGRLKAIYACKALFAMTELKKRKSLAEHLGDLADRLAIGDMTEDDLDAEYEKTGDVALGKFLDMHRDIRGSPRKREIEIRLAEAYRDLASGKMNGYAEPERRVPMIRLLTTLGHMGTTDPRDKLYALLSLTTEGEDTSLKPSYTESAESVYTRFARHLIAREASGNADAASLLILLSAGLIRQSSDRKSNLPTWVFDWSSYTSNPLSSIILLAEQLGHYRAAGNTAPRLLGTSTLAAISMAGGLVDSVASVVEGPSYEPYLVRNEKYYGGANQLPPIESPGQLSPELTNVDFVSECRRYLTAVEDLLMKPRPSPLRTKPDEKHEEVLWRTLTANVSLTHESITDGLAYGESYRNFRKRLAEVDPKVNTTLVDHEYLDDDGLWYKAFFSLCHDYTICETPKGFVGLVPRCATKGDEIHIILGACTPVVLRRTGGSKGI